MKNNFIYAVLVTGMMMSCSSAQQEEATTESGTTEKTSDSAAAGIRSEALVMWSAVGVRGTAENDGKYLTTLYEGEKVTLMGESAADPKSAKDVYAKVQLSDGTEGYALERLLAPDAKPATMAVEADIYKRPDLLAKGDKKFNRMAFVAVQEEEGDWLKVMGVAAGSNWFTTGYVQKSKVSLDAVDVSFAALMHRAQNQKNEEKRSVEVKNVLSNTDLQASQFFNDFDLSDEAVTETDVTTAEMEAGQVTENDTTSMESTEVEASTL